MSITAPASGATVSATASVTANASDNVGVAGVQFRLDGATLGAELTAAPYTLSWDTTTATNGSHTLTAVARDAAANTATSAAVTVTVNNQTVTPPALPAGWSHADVGAVGPAGNATYDSPSQTFSVTGAGADVWGTADAFHYAYTTLTGNGSIVARVASISAGANWIKAGVMLRGTLDPSSAQGFMLASYAKGLAFQRRVSAGGVSTSTAGGTFTAPRWLKLERSGDTITASQSADGVSWTVVATDTIAMGSQILAGLAVSSHTNTATATATFDHVSIAVASGPPPDTTPPTVSILISRRRRDRLWCDDGVGERERQRGRRRRAIQAGWREPRAGDSDGALHRVVGYDQGRQRIAHADRGRARRGGQRDNLCVRHGGCEQHQHRNAVLVGDDQPGVVLLGRPRVDLEGHRHRAGRELHMDGGGRSIVGATEQRRGPWHGHRSGVGVVYAEHDRQPHRRVPLRHADDRPRRLQDHAGVLLSQG